MGGWMSDSQRIRSFYRVAKTYPPGDTEYLTARERRGDPPAGASEELQRSYDGLSAFDSSEGARALALRLKGRLGRLIVRYDIPDGSGVVWEKTLGPGHYDLYGDKSELKRYLTEVVEEV
jgi:hypothetical protein